MVKNDILSWLEGKWFVPDDTNPVINIHSSEWATNMNSAYPVLKQYNGDFTDFQKPWSSTGKLCETVSTENKKALDTAHESCLFPTPLHKYNAFPDPSTNLQCGNRDRVKYPLWLCAAKGGSCPNSGNDTQVIGTLFCSSPNIEQNDWTCASDNNKGCTSCCQYQYNFWYSNPDGLSGLGCPSWKADDGTSTPVLNPNSNGGVWWSDQTQTRDGSGEWQTTGRGNAHPSFLPKWAPCLTGKDNNDFAGNGFCSIHPLSGGQKCLGNPVDGNPTSDTKSFQSWCGCYVDSDCRSPLTCDKTTKQCVCSSDKECANATGGGYVCKGSIKPENKVVNDSTDTKYNPGACVKISPETGVGGG